MLRIDIFPIFYLEVLLSLIFVVSIALIVLSLKTQPQSPELVEHERFNFIELKNYRPTDILAVSTNSSCPLVVSFELNHTVTAWSPKDKSKHVLSKDLWPINHIAVSDDGIYIIFVSFGKQTVYCFEHFKLKWTKPNLNLNRNSKILVSFFRERTVPGYLTRKIMKRGDSSASLTTLSSSSKVNGNFPPPPNPITQQRTSVVSKNAQVKDDFIMITHNEIITVSCNDGDVKSEPVEYLIAATKLKTPRVNDRIICQNKQGDLTVGVSINNKFVYKKLPLKQNYMGSNNPFTNIRVRNLNPATIIPVDFIGMIVVVQDLTARLIDVNTGIVLKTFNIGQFKAGTFKVAHSQPTHCKFCGCVSMNSFSLIYQDDKNTLIVHTFKIDTQRSKNSICFRVERDPREIRCLGFNVVSEYQFLYENIKYWQVTDVNTIIGLEQLSRISEPTVQPTSGCIGGAVAASASAAAAAAVAAAAGGSGSGGDQGLTSLRLRKQKTKISRDKYEGIIISLVDGKKESYPIDIDQPILSSAKYGFKSILINFGDSMKIFYQGTNKLIENDLYYNNRNNGSVSSLLFFNKRRSR
ncbi:hypothetical protein KGF56_001688 [Candida oxycetoniae]|uniref:Uncharacterized protein n=1 Tax=Candida oxycetoniae TaxID=497107 RepID=A0AAI9T0B9_9ASCO|nr:uncharacterized protein KGF56_001688 [Candida oxycetoniae]KAI3405670.2 hypothetical protein KGF56_001688 [Candida oxycetoniae]